MAALGIPFFAMIFMSKMDGEVPAHLSTIVAIGSIQSMLSKATKNALFDATTQVRVRVCVRVRLVDYAWQIH